MAGLNSSFRCRPSALTLVLAPEDLVNLPVAERDHEQVAVWSGLDVGADAEVPADQERLAFGDLELVEVVRDPVLDPRVVDGDAPPVAGQVEVEQVPADQRRASGAHEQVVPERTTEAAAFDESDR